jgi:lysozyme
MTPHPVAGPTAASLDAGKVCTGCGLCAYHRRMSINVVVDLSHADGHVDFVAAAADGIVGVVHKATEGVGHVDPRYTQREPLARAAGLLWGAYHFGTGRRPGAEQADAFLATVGSAASTLLVLDLEANPSGPSMSLEQARDFVVRVHAQTGRWPGLYAGSYLREQLGDAPETTLTSCWLWVAEYGPAPTRAPRQWASWTMWQYTDGRDGPAPHTVVGIGPCDRDRFNGDLSALQRFWTGAGLLVG